MRKPNMRARRPRSFVACCSGRAISLARAVGGLGVHDRVCAHKSTVVAASAYGVPLAVVRRMCRLAVAAVRIWSSGTCSAAARSRRSAPVPPHCGTGGGWALLEPFGMAACPLGRGAIVRLGPIRGIVGFCTRRCAVTASRNGSGRTASGQVREEDRQGARAVVVGGIRRQGSAAPLEHGLLVPHASADWDGLIEQCRIRTCSACLCVRVCVRVCAIDAHGLDH